MPKFSNSSKANLYSCHDDLITLFEEVIKHFDCTIICGHRGKADQNKAYKEGYSTLQYPNSNHNRLPSLAVDVIPYKIEWDNINRMRYFAGFVKGIASQLYEMGEITHYIISGLDWDDDTILKDTNFIDAVHFELK